MATGIPFGWQVENSSGTPVSGAKVYTYRRGTTTPTAAYTDSACTTPAANPIVCDATGFFNAYRSASVDYTIVYKSADDATTYRTEDWFADSDADVTGEVYAASYGVTADGTTDDTIGLQAAVDAAGSGVLILPVGTIIHTTITLGTSGLTIRGQGKDKTILKLKASTNDNSIFATGKNGLTFEDLTIDQNVAGGNTGEGSHAGVRLEGNPTDTAFIRVRVTGARGTFSAAPVGGGIGIVGGSRLLLQDCKFDDCYDGVSIVGTDEVTSIRTYASANQRNGILIGTSADNFRQYDTVADGNSTTYAGAGVLILDSLYGQSFGGTYINSTLGHGLQHNGSDYCEVHGGTYSDNGISGLDFFDSLYGQVHGGIGNDNAIRGLEIDSASNGGVVYGFSGSGNGDEDVSVFRSSDVALRDIRGSVRVWDAAELNTTGHTINAAGSGYDDGTFNVTIVGGTFATAGILNVTVSGGAVTAINSVTNAGNYWTLPANPVSVTGLTSGTGATLNVDWSADNSGTCADLEVHGGMDGQTLLIVSGASADARVSNIRGTITDPGAHISSAVACDAFNVPFKTASLQNSWAAATRAIYYKDADGIVHIEGRIDTGTVAANTLLFTLDAGFRPANTEYFLVPVSGGTGAIYIGTDGTVRDLGGSLNATWSSLNGMSFRAV